MDRIIDSGVSADYFGIHKIASIILLIIPVTAWVLGIATRCKEGKFVAAILRFIFDGWILGISNIVIRLWMDVMLKYVDVSNASLFQLIYLYNQTI